MTVSDLQSKLDYWVTVLIESESEGYCQNVWTGQAEDIPKSYLDWEITYIEPSNRVMMYDEEGNVYTGLGLHIIV